MLDIPIRYGNERHFLGVGLTEEEGAVYITVRDRGRGIASEDCETTKFINYIELQTSTHRLDGYLFYF
ncbi:ATP-binding protein [Paenibacillus antarcticus]|uniref:Histidine kinase/HSP90-like ATPase domain-containing protein n=1 Tax=Paenibacillus antarcticus TaxID=253703 RepID=A0A168Q7A1_9BACL|nr:ATP-binding protein [Paenibacillus antarcticus]OAB47460.1 hypothetical protein PBAT_07155 [Paenibacillus antarcticus]